MTAMTVTEAVTAAGMTEVVIVTMIATMIVTMTAETTEGMTEGMVDVVNAVKNALAANSRPVTPLSVSSSKISLQAPRGKMSKILSKKLFDLFILTLKRTEMVILLVS
jgi:hypothetical protein